MHPLFAGLSLVALSVLAWRRGWVTKLLATKPSPKPTQSEDFWIAWKPKPSGTPSLITVMADIVDVATCDRHPSAVAAHFAVKGQALLSFCGHCGSRHELALLTDGWEVLHALVPVPVTGG